VVGDEEYESLSNLYLNALGSLHSDDQSQKLSGDVGKGDVGNGEKGEKGEKGETTEKSKLPDETETEMFDAE
jgi:hypothetical protein